MGLKKYYIDTSPLPSDAQKKAMTFIENNAWTSSYIPRSNGCYECTWEDTVNPLLFPELSQCIVEDLP